MDLGIFMIERLGDLYADAGASGLAFRVGLEVRRQYVFAFTPEMGQLLICGYSSCAG